MSALSFSAAVAVRPVAAGNVVRARSTARTANTTKALGGFGVNMPKEEYQQKMEAKSRLIAANKARAAAGKPQGGGFSGFSFGKKAAESPPAPVKAPASRFSFGKKETPLAAVAEKKSLFSFGKKAVVEPPAPAPVKKSLFSFGRKDAVAAPVVAKAPEKKSLFGFLQK